MLTECRQALGTVFAQSVQDAHCRVAEFARSALASETPVHASDGGPNVRAQCIGIATDCLRHATVHRSLVLHSKYARTDWSVLQEEAINIPITALDPTTALLVVDLQAGMLGYPAIDPVREIIYRAATLAAAFRRCHLPVVLVNLDRGSPGRTEQNRAGGSKQVPVSMAMLVSQLDRQPSDHTVTKQSWNAFAGTGLDEYLKQRHVSQVVIAGISTSLGVESTARHAYESGFNVTLALDAMTDSDAAAHFNSVTRIFPRLGETGSTEEIVAVLAKVRTGSA
jgi:nicotinamidase-related amidase